LAYLGEKQELRRTIHLELKEARIRELTYEPRIENQFSYRGPKAVLLAAIIAAASSYAKAETPAPPAAARMSISQVQLALVGSAAVGGGTLRFKGRNYPFTINGLGVGGLGVSKLEATGAVYQLARISDLEGVYGQVRVG
jgi:hypothetical protein